MVQYVLITARDQINYGSYSIDEGFIQLIRWGTTTEHHALHS